MMKPRKNILWVALVMAAVSLMPSCNNAPQTPASYIVEGILPDSTHHGEQIYLQRQTDGKTMGLTCIEGNRFTFTGSVDTAEYCRIDVGKGLYSNFILENGNIRMEMKRTNGFQLPPFATGTPGNTEFARIWQQEEDLFLAHSKRIDSLRQLYPDEENFMKAAQPIVDRFKKTIIAQGKEQLASHRNDAIGYSLLHSAFWDFLSIDEQIATIESTGERILLTDLAQEKLRKLRQQQKTQPGMPYVDIKGKDADGNPIALSDFIGKGNYVLIDMWASWCVPCKEEIPNIAKAYGELKDKGLTVVGIFVWDKPENLAPCLKELPISWPQIVAETSVQKDYGVRGIPELILFAPDGTIVERGANLRGKDMTQTLKKYMKIK